nr:hypothetical protein [uncultured Campylobacter sp.]
MFEGDFTYKDLKLVDDEIGALSNFKNLNKQWCHAHNINKIIDKFKHKISIGWGIECIENLLTKCIKYENKIDKIRSYVKDIMDNKYNLLSEESKKDIDEIYISLTYLKENGINSINIYTLKKLSADYEKIFKILKEEKEIIDRHIKSRNIKEQKDLNHKFLEKESILYDVYNNLSKALEGASIMQSYIRHMKNSMHFNFLNLISIAARHIILLFWIVVFAGGFFCLPYFYQIETPPQINTTEIIPLLLFIGAMGLLYTAVIGALSFIGSYFIFNVKTNQKWINIFFIIIQIYLFLILVIPIIYYKFESSRKYIDFISNYFGSSLIIYFISYVLYAIISILKTNKFKDDVNLFIFFPLLFDFLLMVIIYFRCKEIELPILLCFLMIVFIPKMIAFLTYFDYRTVFWLSFFIIGLGPICLLSPDFVGMIKLANYKANFTVKNGFVESEKLDKIPLCFKDYNDTCKNLKLSDDNKTAINNLIIKVKFDEQYFFKAQVPKDEFNITKERIMRYQDGNSTDISQKMFKIFKVKECEHNSTVSCYIDNDKEDNITIKHYHKDMENIIQNENDKYFIEFPIRKENILN